MLRWTMLLLWAVVPAMGQSIVAPEVTMRFSSARILLGEPVWIMETAHNTSGVLLRYNPGDYCFMFSQQPVTAVVPEAAPGGGKPERCNYGAAGGNCMAGGNTAQIAPGESATWRYLLEGNFHFGHPGTYRVELTSNGKAFQPVAVKAAEPGKHAPVIQTLTIEVMPGDDATLLAREKQMAAEMEAEIMSGKRMPTPELEREALMRDQQSVRQIRRGLAAQPAPGMEEVFAHWLQLPNDFETDAIAGLKSLNSPASRAELAKVAKTPNKPNSYIQQSATYALGEMSDPQYYPLMVELLTSPNQDVRRAAIAGVGRLGGLSGVQELVEVAHTGNPVEQGDAVTMLGDTQSRAAVKYLIDLILATDLPHPLDAEWPLFILTHHHLPRVSYLRTARQTQDAWQQWWDAGGKDSPVFSPFECAPKDSL